MIIHPHSHTLHLITDMTAVYDKLNIQSLTLSPRHSQNTHTNYKLNIQHLNPIRRFIPFNIGKYAYKWVNIIL